VFAVLRKAQLLLKRMCRGHALGICSIYSKLLCHEGTTLLSRQLKVQPCCVESLAEAACWVGSRLPKGPIAFGPLLSIDIDRYLP
jgi:hypothetical protein